MHNLCSILFHYLTRIVGRLSATHLTRILSRQQSLSEKRETQSDHISSISLYIFPYCVKCSAHPLMHSYYLKWTATDSNSMTPTYTGTILKFSKIYRFADGQLLDGKISPTPLIQGGARTARESLPYPVVRHI